MPVGAIMGLKKMVTSPFGPAILLSIALGTVIGIQYFEIKDLEKKNETNLGNAASLKVAKDVCEGQSTNLRSRIQKITDDLLAEQKKYEAMRGVAAKEASEQIDNSELSAREEVSKDRTAEEMTKWYQEAFK